MVIQRDMDIVYGDRSNQSNPSSPIGPTKYVTVDMLVKARDALSAQIKETRPSGIEGINLRGLYDGICNVIDLYHRLYDPKPAAGEGRATGVDEEMHEL